MIMVNYITYPVIGLKQSLLTPDIFNRMNKQPKSSFVPFYRPDIEKTKKPFAKAPLSDRVKSTV